MSNDPVPFDPLTDVSPPPKYVMTPEQARRPETPEQTTARLERYRELLALLEQWASEDPEGDQYFGAILEEELKKGRGGYDDADQSAA